MFTVCIKPVEQGFRVWTEQDEPEPADADASGGYPSQAPPPADPAAMPAAPEAPEAAESAGHVVTSLKEALTMAMEALKSGGQMRDNADQVAGFNTAFGGQ